MLKTTSRQDGVTLYGEKSGNKRQAFLAWEKEVILFQNDDFVINYACSVWASGTTMLIGLKVLQSKLMLNYVEVLEQNSRI